MGWNKRDAVDHLPSVSQPRHLKLLQTGPCYFLMICAHLFSMISPTSSSLHPSSMPIALSSLSPSLTAASFPPESLPPNIHSSARPAFSPLICALMVST